MRVCICDDDKNWRDTCRQRISAVAANHEISLEITEFESGGALLFEAEDIAGAIDLLLLDISMPGADGLEVAEKIRNYGFAGALVFITVSGKHYADAFDLRAVNYIEKNQVDARFNRVIGDVIERTKELKEEYINISCAGVSRNIPIGSILYFEVAKSIITVYYGDKQSMEFYSTLDKIEEKLFGHGFVRAHRSFLVNLNKISEMKYSELTMNNGIKVPVSRRKADEIRNYISK